jgi:ketosteroid isomerase-like protein
MNETENLLKKFYVALHNLDYESMQHCYHPEATFEDPVFGKLDAKEVKAMWKMLCLSARELSITIENISADQEMGACDVTASYLFSQTGRQVINRIHAEFHFKEGKIVEQRDRFDLWKWSRQALGMPGWLLGWAPFFKKGIRQKARSRLKKYMVQDRV